jgi:hypothetical protein
MTGVKDLPANAAWLAGRARQSPAKGRDGATEAVSTVGSSVGSALVQAGRAIADHVPFAGNDSSVDALIDGARTAAEQAREAEARAVALAHEARQAAEEAKRSIDAAQERARQAEADAKAQAADRVDKVKAETSAHVAVVKSEADERVQEARRQADERLADERRDAKQQADEAAAAAKATAEDETRRWRHDAQEASDRAQEAVTEAHQAAARARELADQAARVALDAAATAGREAERLAAEAGDVRTQVAAYEPATGGKGQASAGPSIRKPTPPRSTGRRPSHRSARRSPASMPLNGQSKTDLLRLAAELDIDGRTTMSKPQLVNAIKKAPARRR